MGALLEKILERVEKRPDGCWVWTGATYAGYGRVRVNGKNDRVHRVVYELIVGEIGPGKFLDHLCRVRACCNPAHLEPVTNRENTRRGEGPTARNARKLRCDRGHDLAVHGGVQTSGRYCRACRRDQRAERSGRVPLPFGAVSTAQTYS